MEVWKPIPGYGNHYEASSLGRIRVKARVVRKFSAVAGRVVDQQYKPRIIGGKSPNDEGYLHTHISVDGRKYNIQTGRLVLLAFVGEPGPGEECCHGEGGPADNSITNLRWDTHLENNRDRVRAGTYATGEAHPEAKFTDAQVSDIRACDSPKEAKARFGVSSSHYHRIKKGESRV